MMTLTPQQMKHLIVVLLVVHVIISVLMEVRAVHDKQKWQDKAGWVVSIVVTLLCAVGVHRLQLAK